MSSIYLSNTSIISTSLYFYLKTSALFFIGISLLNGCESPKYIGKAGDIGIANVHVITMESDSILKNHIVLISEEGIIKGVYPSDDVTLHSEVLYIEGDNRYLMPGIAEMHAHIPVARDGNDSLVQETLFLYLSNGITLIRGMLGNPYHLELKKQVANNEILSPRIYTSSPSLNGNTVPTPEAARKKVIQYKEDGYDFLKIHPGIQLNVFDTLAYTAKKVGIPFSGHVPTAVGIRNALNFGYASIDHVDGYVEGLVPESLGVHPDSNGLFGMDFTNLVDLTLIDDLVQRTLSAGTWIVPTQSLLVRWTSPRSGGEMLKDAGVEFMNPSTRFQWRRFKDRIVNAPNYNADTSAAFIEIRNKLLKAMYEAGVPLLLGSDAPQIFNVPGYSIQSEFLHMSEAGIPNFAILQSGTVNPAKFFGEAGKYGVIKEGAAADLIMLNGNPLEDLQNMKRIQGVMLRGKWLTRLMIRRKLREIRDRYNNEQ